LTAKKRGPFQTVPVMARAIADRLKLLDGLARRGGARRGERNLKIGTVLVRDYQGRRHTVTVGPEGFVWEGASYSVGCGPDN
jgi:hypothetical protein